MFTQTILAGLAIFTGGLAATGITAYLCGCVVDAISFERFQRENAAKQDRHALKARVIQSRNVDKARDAYRTAETALGNGTGTWASLFEAKADLQGARNTACNLNRLGNN